MLDFFDLANNPNYDFQKFYGNMQTTNLKEWQTWRKPRGAKWIYMIAVGGGASGGCGLNTATTSGGGSGGGAGAMGILFIPAMFVPDVLYIQAGRGGRQPAVLVSAATGVSGVASIIAYEPFTTTNINLGFLNSAGAGAGGAATTTTGGVGGSAGTGSILGPTGRGYSFFLNGGSGAQSGGSSAPTAGADAPILTAGQMVTSGGGGGGTSGAAGAAGGGITLNTAPLGGEWFTTVSGGAAGVGAASAGDGNAGYTVKNYLMNVGGCGGGGSSGTAGSNAGNGGDGAPGCGGGGAGGSTLTNPTLARPGNGGDGFVFIISM